MAYVDAACRAALGVVFAAAVVGKVRSRREFEEFVAFVSELGRDRSPRAGLAAVLVALEAATVVLLVAAAALGFVLALALVTCFAVVVASAVRSGRRLRCRCFGGPGELLGGGHLVRHGALALVAVAGLASHLAGPASAEPAGLVVVAGLAGLAGLLVTRWDDLAFLLGSGPVTRRQRT